jgi:4-amino-4-deoxy-L-arabinose transferase-like glycosyltransferase
VSLYENVLAAWVSNMKKTSEFVTNTAIAYRFQISLALILMLAFALRIWGINFGLPHIYHTDEWFEVKRALKLGAGVFDFERVHKGGYFYLLFAEYGVYFVILKIFGIIKSSDEFLFKFFQDPTHIWLIGRLTTAVIGTLNVYVLYLVGKHAFSKNVGLLAGLFLAIHLIHVESSHYITVDVPLTCLITLLLLIMCWKAPGSKIPGFHYTLLGIITAFAVMTKIPGAVIILPFLLFHWQNLPYETKTLKVKTFFLDRRIWYYGLSFAFVYLCGNPGILLRAKEVFTWLFSFFVLSPASSMPPEFPQSSQAEPLILYYLGILFPWRLILLSLLIWSGFILGLKRYRNVNYLSILFLVPYFFFLTRSKSAEHIYPRYVLPMVPILCIYGGVAVDFIFQKLKKTPIKRALSLTVTALAVVVPLQLAVSFDMELKKLDIRTYSKIWVEKNIRSDKTIIMEGDLYKVSTSTIPLLMKPEVVEEVMSGYLENNASSMKEKFYITYKSYLATQKTYRLILSGNKSQLKDALENNQGDFIILREKTIKLLDLKANQKIFPELHKLVTLAKSVDFFEWKKFVKNSSYRGPTLIVYKRKQR